MAMTPKLVSPKSVEPEAVNPACKLVNKALCTNSYLFAKVHDNQIQLYGVFIINKDEIWNCTYKITYFTTLAYSRF